MRRYIIRTMTVPHCKLGPQTCEVCRATSAARTFILDIDPPEKGLVERPIVELVIGGVMRSFEYDVVKGFLNLEEALAFDDKHGLGAVVVDDN